MRIVRGIEVLETIDELVAPEHSALLVIDVQNDEASPDGAMAKHGNDITYMTQIIPALRSLLDAARERGVQIIYTVSTKSSDGRFETGPALRFLARKRNVGVWDYKREGTWGNAIAEGLAPRSDERQIVKFHSSAFVGTPVDHLLRFSGTRTGIVVGTATEGCVEATVRSLQDNGYYPVIVSDCVTSKNRELHEAALTIMRARWDVVTSGQLIDAWRHP